MQFIVCSLNINSVLLSQCDNKEHFIERIKEMNLEVQRSLVEHIQQVGYMSMLWFISLSGYHLACYFSFNFGIFNKTSKETDVLQST